MTSNVRQNFHESCEAAINKQINLELYASYVYLSMAYHFERDDVALDGFRQWCLHSSDEETVHAKLLMNYQNMRGGRIVLQDIKKPEKDNWGTALETMETALALERTVNQSLIDLHRLASDKLDAQMTDFIEGEFLKEQVKSINEIATMITELRRCGTGLGEYMYDRETVMKKVAEHKEHAAGHIDHPSHTH